MHVWYQTMSNERHIVRAVRLQAFATEQQKSLLCVSSRS